MFDYKIVIPSHNRANILLERTLKMLEDYDIPHNKIYVFVTHEQYDTYDTLLPPTIRLVPSDDEGVSNNRMFISEYFKQGQPLISIDDDVTQINRLDENGKLIRVEDLDKLIFETFTLLKQNNLALAGIYPVSNYFFMKNIITTDLRFCIGQFRIYFNDKFCEKRKFVLVEDYETTLKYYLKYQGVLRLNNVSVKANYLTLHGGINSNTSRTIEDKKKECYRFIEKYKNYANLSNGSKRCEIKFKKNFNKLNISSLWIGKSLNELSTLAIKSWLDNGYNITLYTDGGLSDKILQNKRITIKEAKDIKDYQNIKDILPFSDLWRYNLIYKTGETWLDMDMILLDQLPYDHIIISSEYTFQRGAFKSKKIEVCNIGVLRFPKGDLIIKSIIDKINKQKKESKFIDNMKTFRKIIVKSDYKDKIAHPNSYCPLPWWSVKESYYNSKYLPKYGVTSPTNEEILNKSTSVHLWNNFTYNKSCIDFTKIDNYSLYNLLKNLYNI